MELAKKVISRQKIALIIISIIILLSFKVFHLTPIGNLATLISIGLGGIGYALFIIHFRKFPRALRWFGLAFLALYIISIFSTYSIHDQSIMSGIIASSTIFFVGMAFIAYFLILRHKINIEDIKILILRLSWVLFGGYLFLYFFDIDFPSANNEDFFGVESLQKGVVNFGAIIYLISFFKNGKSYHLILSIMLFSMNYFSDFQRFITAVYLTCLLLLVFHFARKAVAIKFFVALLILVPLITVFLTTTELGSTIQVKISEVVEVFDSEKDEFTDSSIDVRVTQTEAALKSIEKHPITGVGVIRHSSIEDITGLSYFHVSDIGLIGVLFSFGIIGITIFIFQVRYLILGFMKRRLSTYANTMEFKLYILFILLHTILTGRSMDNPVEFVILVAFIEVGIIRMKPKNYEEA